MWEIINGELPIFYLMKDGTDYMLVDGLMYEAFDMVEPLKVNGDYPTGIYTFHGDGQVFLVNNIQIEFSNP